MTTKEMKELYATGEWICVWKGGGKGEYETIDPIWNFPSTYTLIHIKHKEVLDHVLNGGKIEAMDENGDTYIQSIDSFISSYGMEKWTYEIIPTKQDLSGHYCLATKEHYEQLVKDGMCEDSLSCEYFHNDEIFFIENEKAYYTHEVTAELEEYKPMHYHNNQWHFGSLEHGEELCEGQERSLRFLEEAFQSKPPKRITKYIYHYSSEKHNDYIDGILTLSSEILSQDRLREIKCLIWECDSHDDIKITSLSLLKTIHLEANQKD